MGARLKKIFLWLTLALLAVLAVSMLAAPTVARHYLVDHFPEWVEGAELELDNIDIAWFTGAVRVEGAAVHRGGSQESQLDLLEINVGLWSLLTGHVVIDEVLVQGLSTRVIQEAEGGTLIGGYAMPDTPAAPSGDEKPAEATAEAPSEAYLKSLIVHRFIVRDSSAAWRTPDKRVALALEGFRTDGAELAMATPAAPMSLTIDGLRLDNWEVVTKTGLGASSAKLVSLKQSDVTLNWPTDARPVLVAGQLAIESLALDHDSEQDQLALELEQLSLSGFDGSQPDKAQSFDVDVALEQLRSTRAGTPVVLGPGARLKASGTLSGTLTSVKATAQLALTEIALNAPELGEAGQNLLSFGELALNAIDWGESGLKVGQTRLERFQVMPQSGERALLALSSLNLEDTTLDPGNHLAIERVVLDGLTSHVELTANRKLAATQALKAAMAKSANNEGETGAAEGTASQDKAPSSPAIRLGELRVSGDSHIYLKDNGVTPAYERTLHIEELVVGALDSGQVELKTPFNFSASMGEYSRIDLKGDYQVFHSDPSGQLTGTITGVELVPLSPYALDTTGYFIRTGQLNSEINAVLNQAELGGSVKLRMNKIKLAPGDESQMERIKQRLSMPLDTALGLLRDGDGDVTLEIPLEGNIHSPGFGTGDVVATITTKALTQASVAYLKHMFQPYGAMISVGSWLGKKATAVRLDPLRFEPGVTEISDDQRDYLDKVADLLANKEGLRVTLCGVAGEQERLALSAGDESEAIQPEALVASASERASAVRGYLVDGRGIAPDRLYQCQPRFDGGMSDKNSAVFLEI